LRPVSKYIKVDYVLGCVLHNGNMIFVINVLFISRFIIHVQLMFGIRY